MKSTKVIFSKPQENGKFEFPELKGILTRQDYENNKIYFATTELGDIKEIELNKFAQENNLKIVEIKGTRLKKGERQYILDRIEPEKQKESKHSSLMNYLNKNTRHFKHIKTELLKETEKTIAFTHLLKFKEDVTENRKQVLKKILPEGSEDNEDYKAEIRFKNDQMIVYLEYKDLKDLSGLNSFLVKILSILSFM